MSKSTNARDCHKVSFARTVVHWVLGMLVIHSSFGFMLVGIGLFADDPDIVRIGALLIPVFVVSIILFKRTGGQFSPRDSKWLDRFGIG